MLFARIGIPFVFKRAQGGDQFGSGLRGLYDGVDVASFGGHIRIRETLSEVVYFLAANFIAVRFGSTVDFAPVNNIHSA